MSPDEGCFDMQRYSDASSYASTVPNETVFESINVSHSGNNSNGSSSSRSIRPTSFTPFFQSSPLKKETTQTLSNTYHSKKHYINHFLPPSPPLSINNSLSSSSRSIDNELTREFEDIRNGLDRLSKEATKQYNQSKLDCRHAVLVDEYDRELNRLRKDKRRKERIHVDDSHFCIDTSSGRSSERIMSPIEIEEARAVNSRDRDDGIERMMSSTFISPQRIHSIGEVENREDIRDRMKIEQRDVATYTHINDDRRYNEKMNKKERVRILTDSSTSPYQSYRFTTARDTVQLPPRKEKHTVEDVKKRDRVDVVPQSFGLEEQRNTVGISQRRNRVGYCSSDDEVFHPHVERSYDDDGACSSYHNLLPSVLSNRIEVHVSPIRMNDRRRSKSLFGRREMNEDRQYYHDTEIYRRRRINRINDGDKEMKKNVLFPIVMDVDSLCRKKKVDNVHIRMNSGNGVKKLISNRNNGDERKKDNKVRSNSIGINKERTGTSNTKSAFLTSSQVNGVSYSLSANRERLVSLIKCSLPSIHTIVSQYLYSSSFNQFDIVNGLRKYLQNKLNDHNEILKEKLNQYDNVVDGEKKTESAKVIQRIDTQISEFNYLIHELSILSSSSTIHSSSSINQLRSLYDHLIKCSPCC